MREFASGSSLQQGLPCTGRFLHPWHCIKRSECIEFPFLKPSYHKHIKILIKRTHRGPHISSSKRGASLSVLLLTGRGNVWATSVSKTPLTSTWWGKRSCFQGQASRPLCVPAAGHPPLPQGMLSWVPPGNGRCRGAFLDTDKVQLLSPPSRAHILTPP